MRKIIDLHSSLPMNNYNHSVKTYIVEAKQNIYWNSKDTHL